MKRLIAFGILAQVVSLCLPVVAQEKFGPVNQENVNRVIEKLKKDAAFRKKALPVIKQDIYKFAEETFDLTAEQRKQMPVAMPPAVAKVIQAALVPALEFGGNIKFDGTRKSDLTITIECKTDPLDPQHGTTCGISISSDP